MKTLIAKLEGLLEENPVRRAARQESTPPIARPAAKEKPAEPKTPVDSGKLYRYCQVQLEGMEKSYSYLAEDIPVQVGDWVEIRETEPGRGVVWEIERRRNAFLRPAVANIDQMVVVASAAVGVAFSM